MLFFGSMAIFSTMVTISGSFIWEHEVGKRLQKYIYCAFGAAGVVSVGGLDCGLLQGLGLEAVVVWVVGGNLVVFWGVGRFDWIR